MSGGSLRRRRIAAGEDEREEHGGAATIHVRPHPWEVVDLLYPIAALPGKAIRYRDPSA